RRFDTKFFVARLPVGHEPVHDDIETTNSLWTTAQAALAAARSGEVSIILPTRKNLERLGGFVSVDDVWLTTRDGRFERPRIQPEVTVTPDGRILIDHPTFPAPQEM
ncbi:MAG: NUDIX hydrolase, partial [Acidimicrobiia bacterium]|nr:NUDIX hydrolase [Acidimicrobiia bacterium]